MNSVHGEARITSGCRKIHGGYASSGTDDQHIERSQQTNALPSREQELLNNLGDEAEQLSIVDTIWCSTETEQGNEDLTEMFDDLLEVS